MNQVTSVFTIITFLTLLHYISPQSGSECKGIRYSCSLQNDPDVCLNITDERGKVYLLSECAGDTSLCPFWEATWDSPAICRAPPVQNLTLPGEKCLKNSDCISDDCVLLTCVGLAIDEICDWHNKCHTGLFCN